jgi:O-6-methylguanine DNA methyltransferase
MEMARKGQIIIRYAPVLTPVGQLYVAYRGKAVCCLALTSGAHGFERACARMLGIRPIRDARLPEGLARAVVDHVTGKRSISAPFDLSRLTPFQRMVLKKAMEIPRGEVRSYQWVAKEVGAERAARAVGTALARNPIPFLIPCHRVVRADGRIGRYSGGGPGVKAMVLAFEGLDLEDLARAAARRIRFVGSDESRTFCLPSCHRGRRISGRHAVYFATQQDAMGRRYRPCQACRPV